MKIIINGQSVDWSHDSIAFADVQRIAFSGRTVGAHKVTFQNAAQPDGELKDGDVVKLKEGATFTVTQNP